MSLIITDYPDNGETSQYPFDSRVPRRIVVLRGRWGRWNPRVHERVDGCVADVVESTHEQVPVAGVGDGKSQLPQGQSLSRAHAELTGPVHPMWLLFRELGIWIRSHPVRLAWWKR